MGAYEQAQALIGQFGLGLLSAFIVAEAIELLTLSAQPEAQACLWRSDGGETYSLEPAKRRKPGTTLTLHLKLAGEFLLNEGLVMEAVRTFADFLPVPIFVNGGRHPVNAMQAPWHGESDPEAYATYLAARFDTIEPLTLIPLTDHVEQVRLPDETVDSVITPLAGVLFVPAGSTLSLQEYGDVTVYVRRMFVTAEERDLLPRWARFVRGVVDSPALNPTASREQIRRDEAFYRVQRAIETQVLTHFRTLAEHDPAAWRSIVLAHNDLIKGWALESRALFEAVCDLVTFETSRGVMTLSEVVEAGGTTLFYFSEEGGAVQAQMLYDARGLVVIDASRFAETAFLKAYVKNRPGLSLQELAPGAEHLFEAAAVDGTQWEDVTSYYTEQGISARVVRFDPVSVPAILIYPPGSVQATRARSALQGGRVSPPIARLLEEYLRLHGSGQGGDAATLHINAANKLIRQVVALPAGSEMFTAALEIIYQNARLFAGQTLTHEEARQGFDMIAFSLSQLLSGAADEK